MKKSAIFATAATVCTILAAIFTFTSLFFAWPWAPLFFGAIGIILSIISIVMADKEQVSKVNGVAVLLVSLGVTTIYLVQVIKLAMLLSELE